MKRQIGRYLFLPICILIAGNVYGQGTMIRGAVASNANGWPNHFKSLGQNARFAAEAADLSISYFDPTAPTYSWIAPANWGTVDIVAFAERITLPSDSGFIDSLRIVFDAISGDSVAVVLDPDTILLTPAGLDHLDATVFSASANSIAQAVIYPSQLNGSNTAMITFPHIAVPQNFHVVLVPSASSSSYTASYSIRGDTEVTHVRTTDNCHSTFIAIDIGTGQAESGVMDSNLTPAGFTSPLYSNLYITAFVSSAPSSVMNNNASPAISVFPDPASSFLQIQGVSEISYVELLDLLGRTVLSAQMNGNGKLDVSQLLPGRYEAIVHFTNGVATVPVIIQR